MFTRKLLSAWCFCLLAAGAAFAQTAPELNLTLGEQRVRFAPTRGFQEMRLEVVNSLGESVFTHTTTEAAFDWNLRAGNGEALAPGLYRYALTLKFAEDLSRQHTGHFIVEQGQDQIWLTASDGAEVSGTALNAARSGGRSVAGFRTTEDKSAKRDVSGREIVDEKGNKLTDSTKAVKQEKAALLGTPNLVAKFDGSGVNLIDSAISETGGNVAIGTLFPNAKLSVTANAVAPPSAPGIVGYFANANENNTFITADAYGNGVVHSDFLFRRARGTMAAPLAVQANDIIGQIQARGYGATGFATTARAGIRMVAAETWSDTAQGAYLAFMSTPNLSNTINVERMRITDAGNVGIGTTTPSAKLEVVASSPFASIQGSSSSGTGISGNSVSGTGVYGYSSGNAYAVYGLSNAGDGVTGDSYGSTGIGVHGYSLHGSGYAGYFSGRVRVVGVIEKAGGGFKIDHPLEPENKYLIHSFVESPDMKNLYDGTVTTDANGEAEIMLPDWFEALNRDFRYQLTCIGVFAQAMVAEEIKERRFKVRTSLPQVRVSWQVTGTRQDAWANQNRLPVEELKPEVERGSYQNPTAFGQPEEKSIEWARNPARMQRLKEEQRKLEAATKPDKP